MKLLIFMVFLFCSIEGISQTKESSFLSHPDTLVINEGRLAFDHFHEWKLACGVYHEGPCPISSDPVFRICKACLRHEKITYTPANAKFKRRKDEYQYLLRQAEAQKRNQGSH